MTELELYKPNEFYCTLLFPTMWDELLLTELELIATALTTDTGTQDLLISMMQQRAKHQGLQLPDNWQLMLNFEAAATEALPLVDNLLANINLTVNPYPRIKELIGPETAFSDMMVGEFEEADGLYNKYCSDKNESHLLELARLLWRQPADGSSKRYPYSDIEQFRPYFMLKPDTVKLQVIYLWFTGCRRTMVHAFAEVFEGGEPSDDNIPGITKLIHAGAGAKNGTREYIRKHTPLLEFMYDCKLEVQNIKRIEAQNH